MNTLVPAIQEVKVVSQSNEDNTLKLVDSTLPLPLRIETFNSEKDFDAFIKNVERHVRSSLEYRLWTSYITEILGNNSCVLTHEKISECSVVVHHHPINLYTVTKSVINDFLKTGQKFSTFDISLKVIELHYQNKVGYMLLLSNLHEKFHNGFQKIPIEYVNGDYKFILNNYIIDDDQRLQIMEHCNTHINDCKVEWSKESYPGLATKKQEVA